MLRRQHNLPNSRRRTLTGQPVSARRSRVRGGGSRRGRQRRGLTLVEMMVAVVILSVGLLGLASTAAVVTRLVGGGANQTVAANAVQSRLEWMRSMPCSKIKDSVAVNRGVREHWVPGATVNRVLWVKDTLRYRVGGTWRTQVYTMTVQCQ